MIYIWKNNSRKHKKQWIHSLANVHPLFQIVFKFVNVNVISKRWWGKLFHSLMILTKKDYLKAFSFADVMRILNELLDLVLFLQNSK